MEVDATMNDRIAVLLEEIDLIHFANIEYWSETVHDHAATAAYYRRQDRLKELRSKLADLSTPIRYHVVSRSPDTHNHATECHTTDEGVLLVVC